MANIITSPLPNNIYTGTYTTFGALQLAIKQNDDAHLANALLLDEQRQLITWNTFNAALLAGTPATYLTGDGTGTYTLAIGTVASVPVGVSGAHTKAVIVILAAALTAGAGAGTLDRLYLRQLPTTGVQDLVVVTDSAAVPNNSLYIGHADTSGGVIGTIDMDGATYP
jgi:hypothetical protein